MILVEHWFRATRLHIPIASRRAAAIYATKVFIDMSHTIFGQQFRHLHARCHIWYDDAFAMSMAVELAGHGTGTGALSATAGSTPRLMPLAISADDLKS